MSRLRRLLLRLLGIRSPSEMFLVRIEKDVFPPIVFDERDKAIIEMYDE